MNKECITKLEKLREIIKNTGGCAVAYSGGVDSTLVLTVAFDMLGKRCLAVIATSSTYPSHEYQMAIQWARSQGIVYETIVSEELDIPEFRKNPPNRCYFCKKELFTKIKQVALDHGLETVLDGTNADDLGDFRPGINAAKELGVISPLKEAKLTKEEIRSISREMYRLPVANKPAMACLASRFPYGVSITKKKLKQVEEIEEFLSRKGFKNYRARYHGKILRIEVGCDQLGQFFKGDTREDVVNFVKKLGFIYVTLDLEGYRTGSMNEAIMPIGF